MKRKISEISSLEETTSKKYKNDKKVWVRASAVRNYLLKNTLVDWLDLYAKFDMNHSTDSNINSFHFYILKKGLEFEDKVIKYINSTILPVIKIATFYSDKGVEDTISALKQGKPIIYQAPLVNHNNYTYGTADLLVRSDVLNKLFPSFPPLDRNEKRIGCKFSSSWHYVVIDIKYSTLTLKSNGKNILNSSSFPAYKAQVCIYNSALGEMQGYTPNKAYILGRKYKYVCNNITYTGKNCLEKLGEIDFLGKDHCYLEKVDQALKWLTLIKNEGKTWSIDPPSRIELYPNLRAESGTWNSVKMKIAKKIDDLTLLWHCGVKNRDIGFKKGIKSLKDERCSAKNLGITGKKAILVDEIIKINRNKTKLISFENIQLPKKKKEYFVDFETISEVFDDFETFPESQAFSSIIFLVGIGYINDLGEWVYTYSKINSLTFKEEGRMMTDFFEKIKNADAIYHWSSAEKILWNKFDDHDNLPWIDLCDIFQKSKIVVKDCYNFSLKSVAKAMWQHGMIKSIWKSKEYTGLDCSLDAYNKLKRKNNDFENIINYNEVDCKVMHEIIEYLRKL